MNHSSQSKWALVSLSLSMLLASLSTSIANVALPTLVEAFHVSFHEVQWVILAYLLAITTVIVSVGRIGDLLGHRKLLLSGILLFTFASALCGAAPFFGFLIAARVIQGLGAAIMMALTMAFVSDTVPKKEIGGAMGLLTTMSAIGTALGPTLGGILIDRFGWEAIFVIVAVIGLGTFFLAGRYLPYEHRAGKQEKTAFDYVGTVLLGLTLAAYALAMTLGKGDFGFMNIALLAAAIVGGVIFIWFEARTPSPLIRLEVFRTPKLSAGFAESALVTTVMMTTLVVGPFYLARALGLDMVHVGLVMSIGPLVATLTGVPSGRLADRFGASLMTIVGLTGICTGCFIFSVLPIEYGILGYGVSIAVTSGSYALFQTANNAKVMMDLAPDQRGVISGLLNLSRNLGLITGASVMGAVFAVSAGTSHIITAQPQDVAHGMRVTFACSGALMLIALMIAFSTRLHSQSAVPLKP